eukprot:m.183988 g.183988  ORF g.183988 m.183988 type:complete len:77 (+) comp32174_c0_seq4:125-355(+)
MIFWICWLHETGGITTHKRAAGFNLNTASTCPFTCNRRRPMLPPTSNMSALAKSGEFLSARCNASATVVFVSKSLS